MATVRTGRSLAAMIDRAVRPGDELVVEGHKVGGPRRAGLVLAVLGEPQTPYYRMRWDDGRETVFFPAGPTIVRHRDVPRAPAVQSEEDALSAQPD